MGRIFKTPKDDSVEETLRAMHLANTVDNAYEWGWGWFRTILVAILASLAISFVEAASGFSLWGSTVEWFYGILESFAQWLLDKVENIG